MEGFTKYLVIKPVIFVDFEFYTYLDIHMLKIFNGPLEIRAKHVYNIRYK